jgi:hypothetical protein
MGFKYGPMPAKSASLYSFRNKILGHPQAYWLRDLYKSYAIVFKFFHVILTNAKKLRTTAIDVDFPIQTHETIP